MKAPTGFRQKARLGMQVVFPDDLSAQQVFQHVFQGDDAGYVLVITDDGQVLSFGNQAVEQLVSTPVLGPNQHEAYRHSAKNHCVTFRDAFFPSLRHLSGQDGESRKVA